MNEEFEKWAQDEGYDIDKREDGAYRYVETRLALYGWQASRKQAINEALERARYSDDLSDAISAILAMQKD